MSEIEDRVIARVLERALKGKDKYGTTMERNDINTLGWIIHAQEELLDGIVYLERIRRDLERALARGQRLLDGPPPGIYD